MRKIEHQLLIDLMVFWKLYTYPLNLDDKLLAPAQQLTGLADEYVLIHPWVIDELACGTPKNCSQVLVLLQSLLVSPVMVKDEVLYFIEQHALRGIG